MKFRSPNESPAHIRLRGLASLVGIEDPLRVFLYEINAHQDLRALILVCQNIREILEFAKSTWPDDPNVAKLDSWDAPLDWIKLEAANLPTKVDKQLAAGFDTKERHPLKGKGFGRYPVYSAMCNSHVDMSRAE